MSNLRFEGVRDVLGAFPTAQNDISAAPSDVSPVMFLRALQAAPSRTMAFCSYLLSRRQAVLWASQCVRSIIRPAAQDELALSSAEDWVHEPEEPKRQAALNVAMTADRCAASTWVAFAAAWSGGKLVVSDHPAALAPPELTPKAVQAALLLALAGKPDRAAKIKECVERGGENCRRVPACQIFRTAKSMNRSCCTWGTFAGTGV
jgi:Family of unknown function (DUF6931)